MHPKSLLMPLMAWSTTTSLRSRDNPGMKTSSPGFFLQAYR